MPPLFTALVGDVQIIHFKNIQTQTGKPDPPCGQMLPCRSLEYLKGVVKLQHKVADMMYRLRQGRLLSGVWQVCQPCVNLQDVPRQALHCLCYKYQLKHSTMTFFPLLQKLSDNNSSIYGTRRQFLNLWDQVIIPLPVGQIVSYHSLHHKHYNYRLFNLS